MASPNFKPEPTVLVIFGAGGDLTWRKLVPALYSLFLDGWLGDRFAVIGVDLKPMTDDEFREHLHCCAQEISLRSPTSGDKWQQFAGFKDQAVQAIFGPKDDLYVVSRKDAPRGKVLRLPAANPVLSKAEVVIPEGTDTIVTDFYSYSSRQTVLPTASRLYVTYQLGGPSAIRC